MVIFAVHQPNFLPWIGFFAKAHISDIFIILDDVQMPIGRSYIYRTRILCNGTEKWLSVPKTYKPGDRVMDVLLNNNDTKWRSKHLNIIKNYYRTAPYLGDIMPILESVYKKSHERLIDFNMDLLREIFKYLEISTDIRFSSDFNVTHKADKRIATLGNLVGADAYLSGTGGENYQSRKLYEQHGINLLVLDMNDFNLPLSDVGASIIHHLIQDGRDAVKKVLCDIKDIFHRENGS